MDDIHISASAEPGKRSSAKWLDLDRLRQNLVTIAHELYVAKAALRVANSVSLSQAGEHADRVARLKKKATELCALRAMHRGKKHLKKYHPYAWPGGNWHFKDTSKITDAPLTIKSSLIEEYKWPKT